MVTDNFDPRRLAGRHLLVAGDLMLDEYLWGTVERISPEAPVQIVAVDREEATLGGAGNVIHNLTALGARVSAVGLVGTDEHGRRLTARLRQLGVDTDGVIRSRRRITTRKTRVIGEHQQVLRIDRESTDPVSPRTADRLLAKARRLMDTVDAVIVSDYGKGLVTRRLVAGLAEAARAAGKLVVADPKGLDFCKYDGVTLITPNTREASLASGVDIRGEQDLTLAAGRLLSTVKVDGVLVTRGKHGMAYFERNRPPLLVETRARQVFDVSGAGDTVVAVLSLALAAGCPMAQAVTLANAAAGVVVSKLGTATVSADELAEALAPSDDPSRRKHKTLAELSAIAERLRAAGRRIVLTNGCFDLLHAGHVRLFAASKRLGDVLIVALDDDASVRALKGDGRPVIGAGDRVRILSAIDSIDYVTVFASAELPRLLETLRPDVLAKGSNYDTAQVRGREIVERLGGRVALIPITDPVSSSHIISGIKNG